MVTGDHEYKMAAKAIDIQVKKRKSKRIRAANLFLSNISLDGRAPSDRNKKEIDKNRAKPLLDEEEIQLISNQRFVLDPSSQNKPKLFTSFSTTDAVEESKHSLDIAGSSSSTCRLIGSLECASYNRKNSLREQKQVYQNNLVSGRNIEKHGSLCGKR